MSSSIAQQLVAMGFAPETASAAAGNNRNIDQALTFIQAGGEGYNLETDDSGSSSSSSSAADVAATSSLPAIARGFKCDECGTLLPNDEIMMAHAAETKHSKFRQSNEVAPTNNDKQAKIQEVFDKILAAQKPKEQEQPKVNAAEEEKMETNKTKHALQSARDEQRDREIREYAEQRRRQKEVDDVHRKRVLEQIKLDQEERKERALKAMAKKLEPVPVVKVVEEGYTMLQIRLQDGKTVKKEFKAHEPLMMVRAWIETNHPVSSTFKLMTPFPRKEFTDDDMGASLKALNLVPSANLVVINRAPEGPTQASDPTPYKAPNQEDDVFDDEESDDEEGTEQDF